MALRSREGREGDAWSAPRHPGLVAAVVAAAALLTVVAMAVRVEGDGDGTDAGSPLVGHLLSGMLTGALVVSTIVAGVVGWLRLRQGRRPRRNADAAEPPAWWVRPLATLVGLALLALLVSVLGPGRGPDLHALSQFTPTTAAPADDEEVTGDDPSRSSELFAFVAGGLLIAAAAAALAVTALRSPSGPVVTVGDADEGEELDDAAAHPLLGALDASLADLRSEPDPRRAVVAAYARMEAVLGSAGLPRRSHETSAEYCRRVLERLGAAAGAAARLTALFERARYSEHPIDDAMRAEAIEAVHQVRNDMAVQA